MSVSYVITNISPKKTFYSKIELEKYCATHPAPIGENKFKIELIETTSFELDSMQVDTTIEKNLCLEVLHKLAFKLNNKYIITSSCLFRNYDGNGLSNNWVVDFLKNLKEDNIKQVIDVRTDYKLCNNFSIYINNHDYNKEKEFLIKYNKNNNSNYKYLNDTPIHKLICDKVKNKQKIDLSEFTKDELTYYNEIFLKGHFYVQFREKDICLDTWSYTGRNVHLINEYPTNFNKERYDWCIDCLNGIFKKFK